MSGNYSIERDLKEAEAMVEGLARYVREDALYGNVGSGGMFSSGNMPRLTIGALLLRLRRLQFFNRGEGLDEEQGQRLEAIAVSHQEAYGEWRIHYEKKLHREAHSRLRSMNAFFDECVRDRQLCAKVYLPEVNRRTIVAEISTRLTELNLLDDELRNKISSTDNRIRRFVKPCDFVWDDVLVDVYPRDTFWWLYVRPPEN